LIHGLSVVQLGVGAMHFAWLPSLSRGLTAAATPPEVQRFVLLLTAVVGVLLSGHGLATLHQGRGGRERERATQVLATIGSAGWFCRGLLEWKYPVGVPVMGVLHASPIILGGSFVVAGLWCVAALHSGMRVNACEVPESDLWSRHPLDVHFADAFEAVFPIGTTLKQAAASMFQTPSWFGALMKMRDRVIAAPLGVAARGDDMRSLPAGSLPFRILESGAGEMLLGESESHLDFQLLIRAVDEAKRVRVIAATRVQFNHWTGRAYFSPVAIGHRWLVPLLLSRASRAAWRDACVDLG
jgi:hypothetical protein